MKKKNTGFSLFELLMVIAIISVLILLLLPSISTFGRQSRNVDCKSKMRGMGVYSSLFEIDQNKFPHPQQWVYDEWRIKGPWASWSYDTAVKNGEMWPYIGNYDAYTCEEYKRVYRKYPPFNHIENAFATFSMNRYFSGCWQECHWRWGNGELFSMNGDGGTFTRRSLVLKPKSLVLFAEENPYTTKYNKSPLNDLALGVGNYSNPDSGRGQVLDGFASFHKRTGPNPEDGVSNAVFVDGHVGEVSGEDSKELCTPDRVKMFHGTNPKEIANH